MLFLLGILSASRAAAAQDAGPSSKEAETLANEAYELHAKGEYAKAIEVYVRAYQLAPKAALLYNIAAIYDKRLDDRESATDYYQRFIRSSDADPQLVRRANQRLEFFRTQKEAGERATPQGALAPTASPRAPDAAQPSPPATVDSQPQGAARIASYVLMGVGVAGIGVGSGFGILAMNKNNEAKKSCIGSACTSPDAVPLTQDALSAARVSTVSFIAGGVVLATGLIMFLVSGPKNPNKTTAGAKVLQAPGWPYLQGTF